MQRDPAVLLDLVIAARRATDFCRGLDREAFRKDLKTQAAVLLQIIVMGEAAKKLSAETVSRHPDVQWHEIRGMRDRIVHEYNRVDVDLVWAVVEKDIPELIAKLEPSLPKP